MLAVASDSPASKAGIRKFDLITEIGGTAIKSANDAQVVVDSSRVGSQLSLRLIRQQKTVTLSVTTGDLSDRPAAK